MTGHGHTRRSEAAREPALCAALGLALLVTGPVGAAGLPEFQVTTERPRDPPAVWQNLVFWHVSRELHIWDADSRSLTSIPETAENCGFTDLAVDGELIAHARQGHNGPVFCYDRVAGIDLPAGEGEEPDISGSTIVYRRRDKGGGSTLCAFDVNTLTEREVWHSEGFIDHTAISGSMVAFHDSRRDAPGLYARDIQAGTEWRLTTETLGGEPGFDIHGNTVVWVDTGDNSLHCHDLATGAEFTIGTGTRTKQEPAIHGDIVVWVDHRHFTTRPPGPRMAVWGYNLRTEQEFQISSPQRTIRDPALWGDLVVWEVYPGGIYGARLPPAIMGPPEE